MRTRLASFAALLLTLVALAAGTGSAQAAGYRYWSFWDLTGDNWTYATQGPASAHPGDGSVQGFRFAVSADSKDAAQPRTAPSFEAVCAATPTKDGTKRVALVIDFGTPQDADQGETPPAPRTACAQVPPTPPARTRWRPWPSRSATTARPCCARSPTIRARAAANRWPTGRRPSPPSPRRPPTTAAPRWACWQEWQRSWPWARQRSGSPAAAELTRMPRGTRRPAAAAGRAPTAGGRRRRQRPTGPAPTHGTGGRVEPARPQAGRPPTGPQPQSAPPGPGPPPEPRAGG